MTCHTTTPTGESRDLSCIMVVAGDLAALIRELKAACLANGQSDVECQTTTTESK